ncbi:methyltransferase type 12 [Arthrobacter sp. MYb227]|uniref:DinB family protein n=1 Tax=Arthrobacter sp. MYb227 TaxID=1848601 RepID=UPI000CFDF4C0|nr:DinB family protein [Arthrobacter sp. MYb227]PQZ91601.1 methyltransferase type 12 [Arthrobacter sp. MYb227]
MSRQPIPDTKDWTKVLDSVCEECGQDVRALNPTQIARLIRDSVGRFESALQREDTAVRPAPQVWSPLEYCAHVSDMYSVMNHRLTLITTQDSPTFANWDQDEAAIENKYAAMTPNVVAENLRDSADDFVRALEALEDSQIPRRGYRSNGAIFTSATLAQYAWHDAVHHLYDLGI